MRGSGKPRVGRSASCPSWPIASSRSFRARTRARGHEGLQLSHTRLIALLGDGERSVSEMARLQGVSRQATGVTVRGLESLAYVRRDAHETDGRAIRVRLAERGEVLMLDTLAALEELEEEYRATLGARRFADLVNVAAELHGALSLEDELFEARGRANAISGRVAPDRSPPADHELRTIASLLEERLGTRGATRLGRMLCDESSALRA